MPSADLTGPAGPAAAAPAAPRTPRAAVVVLVAILAAAVLVAGCGRDATLSRQEAEARARTCASLTERHTNAPVTVPPWAWFLRGAAEKSDTQKDQKARQTQNASQIKADCKAATKGRYRP